MRSTYYCLVLAIFVSKSSAQNAPTIEADGTNLIATVPEGGDITFKLGDSTELKASSLASIRDEIDALPGTIATSISVFSSELQQTVDEGLASLSSDIADVKTTGLKGAADNTERIEALEKRVAEMTALQKQQSGIISGLQSINTIVTQLQAAVATALDCNAEGTDCTANLGHVPTCDARLLSDEFTYFGDHGKDVPVGVVATRQCPKSMFVAADRSTVTCQASGWTKVGAECAACSKNCDVCLDEKMCEKCSRGFATQVYIDGKYSQAKLTAGNVILDMSRVSWSGKPYDFRTAQVRKACMVDGDKNSDNWKNCPAYDQDTCSVSDAPYVTIDLKAKMRVGKVRVYHYANDDRTYCAQTIELSTTGNFQGEQQYVHDDRQLGSDHKEANNGVEVDAKGAVARFVRHRASRNNLNSGVHFIEMEVDTAPLDATVDSITCIKIE